MPSIHSTMVETLHHVFPQQANPAGTLYGGWMMNWIVTAGNLAALRLTKRPLLLASIEDLFFLQPVRIGDVVTVRAMVKYIGNTSLEAEAVVFCKPLNEEEKLCTRARMSFVSIDVQGKPIPIEQHIEPADDKEVKMYQYAREIREQRFARIAQRKQRLLDTNLEDAGRLSMRVHRLVFPEDAIYSNLMYGGKLLLMLDEIMAIMAMKYARGTIVTASLDALDFYHPIYVGNVLVLATSLNYAGRSSMEIGVKVLAEDTINNIAHHTCTAFSTCVKVDGKGKPIPLTSFKPVTDVEQKRWAEAEQRKQRRMLRLRESEAQRLRGFSL
ncbi:MAG: acyl-CoA thioesterase [Candidatus Brocadia sp.]|nr:acyl-CoA thioesterase [Candidatus Brocadia sp.]NUO08668.1 acyl-CoA thioesterase [Candidatus Brocadia sp.]